MTYEITNEFTKINETSGTVQNLGNPFSVEVTNKAERNSGFLLFPLQKFSFSGQTIYVRCVEEGEKAEIRVIPFVTDSANTATGGSSHATNVDDSLVANDEEIDNLLDNIFG